MCVLLLSINYPLMALRMNRFDSLIESILNPPGNLIKTVHVYSAGESSNQIEWFVAASKSPHLEIVIMNSDKVRCKHWGPKLIDWLLQSHFHVLLSHVHQGHPTSIVEQIGFIA